jgi:post-segregation antitoxin (ccd killing protein)
MEKKNKVKKIIRTIYISEELTKEADKYGLNVSALAEGQLKIVLQALFQKQIKELRED